MTIEREIDWSGGRLCFADVADAAAAHGTVVDRLPYATRVLLENLCRSALWGRPVGERDIAALLSGTGAADLPLYVARVILPDSSGLPALQDLAALRDAVARAGGDATAVDALVPVDLIVDHSLQVDVWGTADAERRNLARELERNAERYRFLKWAQKAYRRLRVYPPGTGIIHQVNIESIASVVACANHDGKRWAFPDFVIGGDSHTPMVNGLGVLGWGVGGIDAEAAMLGQAYIFPRPQVVGVRLSGRIAPPAMTTDAALLITQRLRAEGVAGCMVEYFGPAVPHLTVVERATIANMAPEYGATCGFFPVDEQTLAYLRQTGRSESHVDLVETYCKANHLWRADADERPAYDRVIEIDLSAAAPAMAGPRRPQDRLPLTAVAPDFRARLEKPLSEGGFGAGKAAASDVFPGHGGIALAAITSCTNTSNPAVMLAAGLVARRAVEKGLAVPSWVKTSMAPGSRVVTRYLEKAGLLPFLETLGFNVIGYGCTTCGGKSGPLPAETAAAIEQSGLVATAVLSGNRNFEGRIHKLIRANYIGAPPLVVLYALAGRIDIDFDREPLGHDRDGAPVYLRDLWPTQAEIDALLPFARDPELFAAVYDGKAAAQSHGFQAHVGPMRSKSRGSVTLRNANPREKPVIRFNYMSHTDDWADFRHCVRLTREIFGQPAFDPYRGAEIQPGAGVQTDDEIDAFIRDHAESAFHPCGTCRMGAVDDPMSVVDPECRVIGVEALRVADSSIFPRITNGNLNGPSIMVGEKASDHILGRTPLARSNQEPWINPRWQVSDR